MELQSLVRNRSLHYTVVLHLPLCLSVVVSGDERKSHLRRAGRDTGAARGAALYYRLLSSPWFLVQLAQGGEYVTAAPAGPPAARRKER